MKTHGIPPTRADTDDGLLDGDEAWAVFTDRFVADSDGLTSVGIAVAFGAGPNVYDIF